MIYQWLNYAVAVLANGRAVKGIPNTDPSFSGNREVGIIRDRSNECFSSPDPVLWEDMGVSDIMMTRVCQKGLMIAFLTHTGLWVGTAMIDLRVVPWDQQAVCEDVTEIDDMAAGNQTVVVRAGNCVGIVSIDGKEATTISRKYEQAFDSYGLCSEFVVAKTRDNKLKLLAKRAQYNSLLAFRRPATFSIEYARPIQEIVCRPSWLLLIMDDGSVYARSMRVDTSLNWSFKRRGPPDRESVIKISHSGDYIIYITERGRCYHTSARDYARSWEVEFVLVPGLDAFIVESAYMLANGKALVVVHDGGKASLLHVVPYIDITWRYIGYRYQRRGESYRLVPLPLFDDESVASITEIGNSIGITTAEGLVYWAKLDELIDMAEPKLIRDQFFDVFPLAVKTSVQRIRSACSSLSEDV